jgi:hypothetical protein
MTMRGTNVRGVNGGNGSGNVRGTDGRSDFVLDKGDRKASLKANIQGDRSSGFSPT